MLLILAALHLTLALLRAILIDSCDLVTSTAALKTYAHSI
jgi:hypothetical protein